MFKDWDCDCVSMTGSWVFGLLNNSCISRFRTRNIKHALKVQAIEVIAPVCILSVLSLWNVAACYTKL